MDLVESGVPHPGVLRAEPGIRRKVNPKMATSILASLLSECETVKSNCWIWTRAKYDLGYGRVHIRSMGRQMRVHRLVWQEHIGSIPSDLELHHECRNTSCYNPSHLKLVSHRANVLLDSSPAAKNGFKLACIRGHAFDERNTYHEKGHKRKCRACAATRQRNRRLLKGSR